MRSEFKFSTNEESFSFSPPSPDGNWVVYEDVTSPLPTNANSRPDGKLTIVNVDAGLSQAVSVPFRPRLEYSVWNSTNDHLFFDTDYGIIEVSPVNGTIVKQFPFGNTPSSMSSFVRFIK